MSQHKTPASHSNDNNRNKFSPFTCVCFTVNYIVGTGVLTLPWAFEKSGIILSTMIMMMVCIIAKMSSDYFLIAMARAERLVSHFETMSNPLMTDDDGGEEGNDYLRLPSDMTVGGIELTDEQETTLRRADDDLSKPKMNTCQYYGSTNVVNVDHRPIDNTSVDDGMIGERKFEIMELCRIFLGDVGFKSFVFPTVLYMYGFLWAYSCVFASAMTMSVPLGNNGNDGGDVVDSYPLYVILFGMIVVPISFLELPEQVYLQLFLSGCRFVMILLIVVTPLLASCYTAPSSYGADDDNAGGLFFDNQTTTSLPSGAPWVRLSGFSQTFPIIVSSISFHLAIPDLAAEVRDKSRIGHIFGFTLGIVGAAYSCIGMVCAWYFGTTIHASANLNWRGYRGFDGGWLASAISFFVVCFPAFDVVSAFTLNAFILANVLKGAFTSRRCMSDETKKNKCHRNFYVLLASVPPIIGAIFQRDLGTITDYTGLVATAIAFCFPALLYLYSETTCRHWGLSAETHYNKWGSSASCATGVFLFGVTSILFSLSKRLMSWQER